MKVLIVDDERLARKELTGLLLAHPEVEIIGECTNADEAITFLQSNQPDVIFLDIQMPGKNGFDLLNEISVVPEVVFVTAYDEYAIKAFEVNAMDYLLKPISPQRLGETIKKLNLLEVKEKSTLKNQTSEIITEKDKVFVKDGDRCWFVKVEDIRLFESEGNYVRIHFENSKPLILKSLNSLESRLSPKSFFRASRKHIINLNWVENIEPWLNGGLMATLRKGERIEISRRQAVRFKEIMSF